MIPKMVSKYENCTRNLPAKMKITPTIIFLIIRNKRNVLVVILKRRALFTCLDIFERTISKNEKRHNKFTDLPSDFNHDIYNICSNKPLKLISVINQINFLTGKKPKTFKRGLQEADVVKTHGSNKKILELIGKLKLTSINIGLSNTVNWFKKYYKI